MEFLRETIIMGNYFKEKLSSNSKFKILETKNELCLVCFKVKDHSNEQTNKYLKRLTDSK